MHVDQNEHTRVQVNNYFLLTYLYLAQPIMYTNMVEVVASLHGM